MQITTASLRVLNTHTSGAGYNNNSNIIIIIYIRSQPPFLQYPTQLLLNKACLLCDCIYTV